MTTASVVVPVLNEAASLPNLIADLRREGDMEIVVVDGGSADSSLAVAAELADQALAGPRGRGAQLRLGAESAHGDWLWFLHADSRVGAGVAAAFRAMGGGGHPSWGFCAVRLLADPALWGGRSLWGERFLRRGRAGASDFGERLRQDAAGWMLEAIGAAMNIRSRLTGIATGDQGIFAHRSLLDAIGGIPEQPLMEDVECCRRLRRLGRPQFIEAPLTASARRWQQHGIPTTVALMWALRLRYFLGAEPAALAERYYAARHDESLAAAPGKPRTRGGS